MALIHYIQMDKMYEKKNFDNFFQARWLIHGATCINQLACCMLQIVILLLQLRWII
jgi:hypothetical protein